MPTANDDYARGLAAFGRRDFDEAERCARAVLAVDSTSTDGWLLWGVIAYEREEFATAVERLVRAVEGDALRVDAYYNLALAHAGNGRDDLAIANYRTAIGLDPAHRSAHYNLVNELRGRGEFDEAVAASRTALAVFPDSGSLRIQLGKSLRDQGRAEEAYEEICRAAAGATDDGRIVSEALFASQYVPGTSPERMRSEHLGWDGTQPAFEPLCTPGVFSNADGPLRVGFLSPDLGYHPVGLFLAPLLEHLDRDRIEAFCYSHRRRIDDQSRRLAGASTFLDVRRVDDDALARRIRDDGIDVLFDLAGHTDENRLTIFARRPAPLHITWAGYVGTTGLAAMDALLADRWHVPPEDEPLYTERVVRMPHGYVCYEPPPYAPAIDPSPTRSGPHVSFGCFNNASKMNDTVLDVWGRILAHVPRSRLVLKYPGCDQPTFRSRVVRAMAVHGVDADRLEFAGRTTHVEHLARLGRIDIALDPFPYSGGLSTLEATWLGVPVVTQPGRTFASRHSLSHLTNVAANGTITAGIDEYIARAIALATSRDDLAREHATLRDRMAASPVCDLPGFATAFADLVERVVREGLNAEHD